MLVVVVRAVGEMILDQFTSTHTGKRSSKSDGFRGFPSLSHKPTRVLEFSTLAHTYRPSLSCAC
jgi:hypothetical protein